MLRYRKRPELSHAIELTPQIVGLAAKRPLSQELDYALIKLLSNNTINIRLVPVRRTNITRYDVILSTLTRIYRWKSAKTRFLLLGDYGDIEVVSGKLLHRDYVLVEPKAVVAWDKAVDEATTGPAEPKQTVTNN